MSHQNRAFQHVLLGHQGSNQSSARSHSNSDLKLQTGLELDDGNDVFGQVEGYHHFLLNRTISFSQNVALVWLRMSVRESFPYQTLYI